MLLLQSPSTKAVLDKFGKLETGRQDREEMTLLNRPLPILCFFAALGMNSFKIVVVVVMRSRLV